LLFSSLAWSKGNVARGCKHGATRNGVSGVLVVKILSASAESDE
jgi:hypothetical protein